MVFEPNSKSHLSRSVTFAIKVVEEALWLHVHRLEWFGHNFELGKPPFEMCWFDVGIAQIALDPFPLSNGQMWKKSAPNHPGKPLHPRQMWKKSAPSHPSKPLHPPPSRSMPIWKQHILKRGSVVFYIKLSLISVFLYSFMANGRSNQRRQW